MALLLSTVPVFATDLGEHHRDFALEPGGSCNASVALHQWEQDGYTFWGTVNVGHVWCDVTGPPFRFERDARYYIPVAGCFSENDAPHPGYEGTTYGVQHVRYLPITDDRALISLDGEPERMLYPCGHG